MYENPRLRIRRDDVLFGETAGDYTVVEACDYAIVAPLDGDGVWLVEQFRYAIGRRSWEFPAGTWPIDPDAADDVFSGSVKGDPYQLAADELAEETGLRASRIEAIGQFHPWIGFSDQRAHVFVARGLHCGLPRREFTEQDMRLRWFHRNEVRAMIARGEIVDSSTVLTFGLLPRS